MTLALVRVAAEPKTRLISCICGLEVRVRGKLEANFSYLRSLGI